MTVAPVRDIRDVMGMRTKFAWALVAAAEVNFLAMALLNTDGVRNLWPIVLVWVVLTVDAVVVLAAPGGDLSVRWAAPIAIGVPVAAGVALTQLPAPAVAGQQLWFTSAIFLFTTFMCVRNATRWAWVAQTGLCVVLLIWGAQSATGIGPAAMIALINSVPLVAATLFGATVRPAATAVLSLREQTRRRATEEAATTAMLEERDAQLRRLDALVRPLLDAIGREEPLSPAQQDRCRLLEARLRDELRGRALVDEDVSAAAARARTAGVTVVMFDDGGLDDAPAALGDRVRATARDVLSDAKSGRVVARVLPPGRDKVATFLVTEADGDHHVDVLADGTVISDR